ncbi:MAG: U32 family peptidase [Clostridiales bacterium]|nr:U32 family peptidase [Clostridiales bacterium]
MSAGNPPLLELLAPAGDMERLHMAVAYGADAVYLAGASFGMRAFAGNFNRESIYQATALCKAHGVACHVTINTMPRNDEIKELPAWLEVLEDAGVDAVIVADLGAFTLAGRYAPHAKRHISTQASICNYETACAWYDLGASRVILARELSLNEVAELRAKTPADLEIEAFVHGAMCVSYSGRCLLSNYMTGRDSSRGACAQPCRYRYTLMEEKRPGEYFPVFEDEKGTYLLNSRDMCMIDHIQELYDAGLNSVKIEGRAKSAYYAAIVTGAYRHAIDAVKSGQALDPVWRNEVEKISHRPYSTGFWFGQPGQYLADERYLREWQICAVVQSCDEHGLATLCLRNKFHAGDPVEIVGPDCRPVSFPAPVMEAEDGTPLEEPRHPQMLFRMQLPGPVPPLSILRRETEPVGKNA